MKRILTNKINSLIVFLPFVLAACTEVTQSAQRATDYSRKETYHFAGRVQKYTRYQPPPTDPQAPQTGYCYKFAGDIVCYERPQPTLKSKLIGYQDPYGAGVMPLPAMASADIPVEAVPVMAAQPEETPFYVKEAPYVKPDGQMTVSSKTLPPLPQQTVGDAPSVSPVIDDNDKKTAAYPRSLMPAY